MLAVIVVVAVVSMSVGIKVRRGSFFRGGRGKNSQNS
jgi:hypothetical protein